MSGRPLEEILVRARASGVASAMTHVMRHDEARATTGISFSLWRLASGATDSITAEGETALLLLSGEGRWRAAGFDVAVTRGHTLDDGPWCLHVPHGTAIDVEASDAMELAVLSCPNEERFDGEMVAPDDRPIELRGKGTADDACLRLVRTVLLPSSLRSDASGRMELDLGEVVTLPGRWSSYPAHRHRQPEIYHYRFSDPRGYGHAELGDAVFRIGDGDTVKILDGVFHSQVAAPGYGMYYFYLSRDAAGSPFDTPEFHPDHAWLRQRDARFWMPEGFARGSNPVGTAGEHPWDRGAVVEFWNRRS